MSNEKIVALSAYRNKKRIQKIKVKSKMFFLISILAISLGLLIWHLFVENIAKYDVKIPPSQNITFENEDPILLDGDKLGDLFTSSKSRLNVIYFYATWCGACSKNFQTINEVAREFQNTELNFMAIALDKDISSSQLQQYLQKFGNVYFKPLFLNDRDGFDGFLEFYNINYSGRIPFTVLLDGQGNFLHSYSGVKSLNYLRKKIIKNLYLNKN